MPLATSAHPPQLQKILQRYRQKLQAKGVPEGQIRKKVHLKAKHWLRQAMDWRMNRAVRKGAMVPGEYERTVALEPQRFTMGDWVPYKPGSPEPTDGAQGTWLSPSQVPKRDLESAKKLVSGPQAFGGLGQPVPPEDLIRGEYKRQLALQRQQFSLSGLGQPVPVGAMVPGEFRRRVRLKQQQFGGLGQRVPTRALRRGEYGPIRLRRQEFDLQGLGQPVPVQALQRGELQSPAALERRSQRFTLGAHESAGQGTWLSPDQVPAWERESASKVAGPNEKFQLEDYEAGREIPISSLRKGEYQKALQLRKQKFGMGQLSPQAQAQLYALRQQAAAIASGYAKPVSKAPKKGSPATAAGQASSIYADPAVQSAFLQREITLPEVCDPESGTCIRWAAPPEATLKTAYRQGQMHLPAFYQHPQLGPWGVDPRQAYQYWTAQQAALQAMPYSSPMSIFGSPGLTATTPGQLPASQTARPASFDPYTQAFPTSGTAVERF